MENPVQHIFQYRFNATVSNVLLIVVSDDDNRVVLATSDVFLSDYINASYIQVS